MEYIEKKYYNKSILNYDKNIDKFMNNNIIEININKNKKYIKKLFSLNEKKMNRKYIKFYYKANESHLNCINALISYIIHLEKYKESDNMLYDDEVTYILKYYFELIYSKNWRKYINDFDINDITKSRKKIELYNIFINRLIKFNYTVINFEKKYKHKLEKYNQNTYNFDNDFYCKIINLYIQLSNIIILYYEFLSKLSKNNKEIFLNYSKYYFIPNIIINYDIKM